MMLTNPELPFPKMRKEGIGIHCTSSLQFGLIDMKFGRKEDFFTEECFEDMEAYLECLEPEIVEDMVEKIQQ